jgi:hypothetical protein
LEYYSYRLAIRNNETNFSALISTKLFHPYIVDVFVKIESNRLNFIKMNQSLIEVEKYKGLMDHIKNQTGNINPPSFIPLPLAQSNREPSGEQMNI